jgi:hypothetical protein
MKKVSLIMLFAVCLSGAAFAQDSKSDVAAPAQTTTPIVIAPNPNAPEITFETETVDYGTIKQGDEGSRDFKFKNTGKEPLVISNAKGSCGCTVPTWPKEPIMKGQTAVIKVHYDTKRVGAFTKSVTIESNAKTNPKVINIKGTVEAVPEASTEDMMPLKKTDGAPLEIKNK